MAEKFDELAERLLYDVALSGSYGFGREKLEKAVKHFYDARNGRVAQQEPTQQNDNDLQMLDASPASSSRVDDDVIDAVWEQMAKHPSIKVQSVQPVGSQQLGSSEPQGASIDDQNEAVPAKSKYDGKRLFTDAERMWHAVAGHGVDVRRIPPHEFDCLSVIAAHGPAGVLQPDVTKLTGQQKQSVPRRTDMLAQKGYITKRTVLAIGTKTSLLMLKKFEDTHDSAVAVAQHPSGRLIIDYNIWFDHTISLLKQQPNHLLALSDLRMGLGILKLKHETRCLMRCIRRLAHAGCFRKCSAKPTAGGQMSAYKEIRCIQLMREPTASDKLRWKKGESGKRYSKFGVIDGDGAADASAPEEVEGEAEGEADGEVPSEAEDEDEITDSDSPENHVPPQWTGDIPHTNLLSEIIDNAGLEGISIEELHDRVKGSFSRQSLDKQMAMLTDSRQHSQLPHLRHLGIVKDTRTVNDLPHDRYRSLGNFEKAVEAGTASRESVRDSDAEPVNSEQTDPLPATFAETQPEMDQWGFPKLPANLFAGRDGRASLVEAGVQLVRDDGESIPPPPKKKKGPKPKKDHNFGHVRNAPVFVSRPLADVDKEQKGFELWANATAEKLVKAEIQKTALAEADGVRTENGEPATKKRRKGKGKKAAPIPPAERAAGVEATLVAKSRPGVYINPPGAQHLKAQWYAPAGGSRPSVIAVVKTERLKGLEFFVAPPTPEITFAAKRAFDDAGSGRETTPVPKPKRRKSKKGTDVVGGGETGVSDETSMLRAVLAEAASGATDQADSVEGTAVPEAAEDHQAEDGEVYNKAYVDAHAEEEFHCIGGRRYKRGPKPPKQRKQHLPRAKKSLDNVAADAPQTPDAGRQSTSSQPQATPAPVVDQKPIGVSIPEYTKDYVLAHGRENFHHFARGRWRWGPKPGKQQVPLATTSRVCAASVVRESADAGRQSVPRQQQQVTPAPVAEQDVVGGDEGMDTEEYGGARSSDNAALDARHSVDGEGYPTPQQQTTPAPQQQVMAAPVANENVTGIAEATKIKEEPVDDLADQDSQGASGQWLETVDQSSSSQQQGYGTHALLQTAARSGEPVHEAPLEVPVTPAARLEEPLEPPVRSEDPVLQVPLEVPVTPPARSEERLETPGISEDPVVQAPLEVPVTTAAILEEPLQTPARSEDPVLRTPLEVSVTPAAILEEPLQTPARSEDPVLQAPLQVSVTPAARSEDSVPQAPVELPATPAARLEEPPQTSARLEDLVPQAPLKLPVTPAAISEEPFQTAAQLHVTSNTAAEPGNGGETVNQEYVDADPEALGELATDGQPFVHPQQLRVASSALLGRPVTSPVTRAAPTAEIATVLDITTYDKAYVEAHKDEKFHHAGHGRYRRGPRPAKQTPRSEDKQSTPVALPVTEAAPTAELATVLDMITYDKAYVEAHQGEQFHHAGQGRYRRGPKPGKQTPRSVNQQSTPVASTVATPATVIQASPLPAMPKKRGRPSNAMLAEQTRLQMEAQWGWNRAEESVGRSLVVKLKVPGLRVGKEQALTALEQVDDGVASRQDRHTTTGDLAIPTAAVEAVAEERSAPAALDSSSIGVTPGQDEQMSELLTTSNAATLAAEAQTAAEQGPAPPADAVNRRPALSGPAKNGAVDVALTAIPLVDTVDQVSALTGPTEDGISRLSPTVPPLEPVSGDAMTVQSPARLTAGPNPEPPTPPASLLKIVRPYSVAPAPDPNLFTPPAPLLAIIRPYHASARSSAVDSRGSLQPVLQPGVPASDAALTWAGALGMTGPPSRDARIEATTAGALAHPEARREGPPPQTGHDTDIDMAEDQGFRFDTDMPDVTEDQPRGDILDKTPGSQTNDTAQGAIASTRESGPRTQQQVQQRTSIILDVLEQCGGVYPGKGEMWYPFVTAWSKLYAQTSDRRTVERAVKNLVDTGKLRKLAFSFRDKDGVNVTRNILTLPGVTSSSVLVSNLKAAIIDAHPLLYLPEEVEILDDLRAGQGKFPPTPRVRKTSSTTWATSDGGVTTTPPSHYSRNEFPPIEGLVVQRTEQSLKLFNQDAQSRGFESARDRRLQKGRLSQRRYYRRMRDDETTDEEDVGEEEAALRGEFQLASYQHTPETEQVEHTNAMGKLTQTGKAGGKVRKPGRWPQTPKSVKRVQQEPKNVMDAYTPSPSIARDPSLGTVPPLQTRAASRKLEKLGQIVNNANEAFGLTLMRPGQTFHSPSGTFGTNSIISQEPAPVEAGRSSVPGADSTLMGSQDRHSVHDGSNQPRNIPLDVAEAEPQAAVNRTAEIGGRTNEDTFDKAYVDSHPGELFYHWWRGQYKRGTKPPKPQAYLKPTIGQEATLAPASDGLAAGADFYTASRMPSQGSSILPGPSVAPTTSTDLGAPAMSPFDASQVGGSTSRPKRKYQSRKKLITEDGVEIGKSRSLDATELEDIVVALGVVKVLCGGTNQKRSYNWDLVVHALSFKYEAEFLRQRWGYWSKTRTSDVLRVEAVIREPFLLAYERGELPPIDFASLADTDWPALLVWAKDVVQRAPPPHGNEVGEVPSLGLPDSTAALQARYAVAESDQAFRPHEDTYFSGVTEVIRSQVAVQYVHGKTLAGETGPGRRPSGDIMLLKSWCRAVAMTKQKNYDVDAAARKIGVFSDALVKKATDELLDDHILTAERKDRQLPGRNFYLSKVALKQFQRWPGKDSGFLRDIAAARATFVSYLDSHDSFELNYQAKDSEIAVLTNMVAQGQLKIRTVLPERNDDFDAPFPKLSAWGVGDPENFYNIHNLDQSRTRFPVVYEKTAGFSAEHGLSSVPIPLSPVQYGQERGLRLPFWIDINGTLIDDIWEMVLRSVLHLVVYRTGTTARAMERAHDGKLWLWEVQMVLGWMEKVGLAVRFGAGKEVEGMWSGGWRAGEWWYCAFAPEIATWEAPVGETS